ncbi:MAG: STAS domain-containing protein [Planctomycetes bacterium]|nr:STAS domain-containing protein [Planctomycetota bacterium]
MSSHNLLEVRQVDDLAVAVVIAPTVDSSNAEALGRHLASLVETHSLHLDLGKVRRLSSVGLVKLVALHKKARDEGRELRLLNVAPSVRRVFLDMELLELFRLEDTMTGA